MIVPPSHHHATVMLAPGIPILNSSHYHIIRLRPEFRRWLVMIYADPTKNCAIESGSRATCHNRMRALIECGDLEPPLYTLFITPKVRK